MTSKDISLYKSSNSVTMPWEEVINVARTVVIDSRQRDCRYYPTPSEYVIKLDDTFNNVNSVELKGAVIPKSSYNVHNTNNKIDFAIGDSVTSFKIIKGGAGFISAPNVIIGSPPSGGITATANAIINTNGVITNIVITNPGSGYIPSKPPIVSIVGKQNINQKKQPKIYSIVGLHYTATLREGEYEIGGNPNPPTNTLPSKLLLEIQNAMNYAVNGGPYNPASTSPFAARVVNQYPMLGAIPGTPEYFNTNASNFNRIQVINVNSDPWELLWYSGPNKSENAATIFGFNTTDSGVGIPVSAVNSSGGLLIPAGTAIRGSFDYDLLNDPDYLIITLGIGGKSIDRIRSTGDDGLDRRFCTLLFDNNAPDTIHDMTGNTVEIIDGVEQLVGNTKRGEFYRYPGKPKAIKAGDFDGSKKISFKPPIGKVDNIYISFTKFGINPGSRGPKNYNMEGREHLLLFELVSNDNRSKRIE